jgi:dipeptidyl aminopeptidase/acylaminoacyl peptidase
MYHSVIGKPSLRVRLLMGLLGLSLLLLSACGGQVSAKGGGDDDEENESASGAPTRNGQIAFRRFFDPDQSEGAIFTVNPDGSHESQITHPPKNGWIDESSDWSPDGQRLAFDRHTPKDMSRIMVLNTKTGDTREVTLRIREPVGYGGPDSSSSSSLRWGLFPRLLTRRSFYRLPALQRRNKSVLLAPRYLDRRSRWEQSSSGH